MKLVANCKDDVQLIVNFKAVVLFIRNLFQEFAGTPVFLLLNIAF